jgi:hypothetical protein
MRNPSFFEDLTDVSRIARRNRGAPLDDEHLATCGIEAAIFFPHTKTIRFMDIGNAQEKAKLPVNQTVTLNLACYLQVKL